MASLAYELLDVFTDQPFGGNQLAVFTDPPILKPAHMQAIARELNLSETVFVYPPADAKHHAQLRIFTPHIELPFAGHPTIGTGYILHHIGRLPNAGQYAVEEQVGVIDITIQPETDGRVLVSMSQPTPQFGAIYEDRARITELLTIQPSDLLDLPVQVVSSGVPFLYIPLRSLDAIRRVKVRLDLWEQHIKDTPAPHLFVFTPETESTGATVHSRMFAPAMGISEDPATGAASGPLGAYLVQYGLVHPDQASHIVSEQGLEMGRPSFIHIHIGTKAGQITHANIGGYSVRMGRGVLNGISVLG